MALKFVLVLEGVGLRGTRLKRNELPRRWIQPPAADIDTLIAESGVDAITLRECSVRVQTETDDYAHNRNEAA
ncbi:MAG TPA: hypothetical protein VK883_02955, partial [Arthrobacter sp.]|nr:hypothetical protein [Arthrobacter sp.]